MSGLGLRGYFEARRRWASIFGSLPPLMTSTVEDPKTWRPPTKIGPSCYMPHQLSLIHI